MTAVLIELVEVMTTHLQDSKRVKIDGLGTFKVGLRCKPAATAGEFNPVKNVKSLHVNFLPASNLDRDAHKHVKELLRGVALQEHGTYVINKKPAGTPAVGG